MNLVAKEYCASSTDGNGVLILSEFAGAAAQFYPNALLVNPYDLEGVADAIYRAVTMDQEERRARMRRPAPGLDSEVRYRELGQLLPAGGHLQGPQRLPADGVLRAQAVTPGPSSPFESMSMTMPSRASPVDAMSETVGAECELLPGHLASAGMAHSTNAKRNPLIFLIEIPP